MGVAAVWGAQLAKNAMQIADWVNKVGRIVKNESVL